MVLMTRFIQTYKDDPTVKDLKEGEKRYNLVKEWLAKEGGVRHEEFEWLGLWDCYGMTRMGITPRRNDRRALPPHRIVPVSEEDLNEWSNSGERISLSAYVLRKQSLNAAKSEQAAN